MVRKNVSAGALALAMILCASGSVAVAAPDAPKPKAEATAPAPAIPPELLALEKGLHPQTGDVRIPEAKAVLHLGENYYFLPAAEAKRVLVEAWGNPPENGEGVLGMVLEKGTTIFDNVWGAVITYEDTGHVSDADAAETDYTALLGQMKEGADQENASRKAAGYPAVHLVGWAQPPAYDKANHSLIWARELNFEGQPGNGLNYDVRLLGRTGVLSLNMLASMEALPQVRTAAEAFGKSASFEAGATYADYNSATDHTAQYGVAGLIAGGAAVAVAKKIGFLAIILKFGKVILIGLAAFGAAGWALFKRLTGRGQQAAEGGDGTL